jgi:hypothetical protein
MRSKNAKKLVGRIGVLDRGVFEIRLSVPEKAGSWPSVKDGMSGKWALL